MGVLEGEWMCKEKFEGRKGEVKVGSMGEVEEGKSSVRGGMRRVVGKR